MAKNKPERVTLKRLLPGGVTLKNPPPSYDEEMRLRRNNHGFLLALAAKLDANEPLNALDRAYTAGALRGMAQRMLTEKTPRAAKRPMIIDPGHAAIAVGSVLLRQRNAGERINKAAAYREVGGPHEAAVKKAVEPLLDEVCADLGIEMKSGKGKKS